MTQEEAQPNFYQWYQCELETCRFRCPALPHQFMDAPCPSCKRGQMVAGVEVDAVGLGSSVPRPEAGAFCLVLDNIRSIYNVGAMFRTADGVGLAQLFCCGMTATPTHPKLAKTALGAESAVAWQYARNGVDTAVSLQRAGWHLWAVERTDDAVNLFDVGKTAVPVALVVGNERAGIDPAIIQRADNVVSLPMMGKKASLNVAVAAGIALYVSKYGRG